MGAGKMGLEDYLEVYTVPVGQGDSTLIRCLDGGEVSIIDMGCAIAGDCLKLLQYVSEIEEYLDQGQGLDYRLLKRVFLTHPDYDHFSYAWVRGGGGLLQKYAERAG